MEQFINVADELRWGGRRNIGGKKMYDTGECIWLKYIGAVNQWRSSIAHVKSRGV